MRVSHECRRDHPARRRGAGLFLTLATLVGLALLPLASRRASAAEASRLPLQRHSLELPGAPAAVVPADIDGDGVQDLVMALVYTEYDEISFEKAEGFVQMTEVVPALFDRRELRLYRGLPEGGYRLAGGPVPLPPSVHSIESGMEGYAALALTDDGVSAIRWSAGDATNSPATLSLEPLIEAPTVLAGTGSFLPGLEVVNDLDGDRIADVLLPAATGPASYLTGRDGPSRTPAASLVLPGDERGSDRVVWRRYPLPVVEDVDGDGLADLVLVHEQARETRVSILRGAGAGRFDPPRTTMLRCLKADPSQRGEAELVWFGDLDGDSRAEAIVSRDTGEDEDEGLDEAKKPHHALSFHRLRQDLTLEPAAYRQVEVIGYPFGGQWPDIGKADLKDLDGDGRKDLVTVTLDFSLWQVLRVMTTKRVGVGLQFHVWAQGGDGVFREVAGQDLSEKLTMDLNDLRLSRFAHFNGDFDGDGRRDFVRLGRGRKVAIHLGQAGCRYAEKPDQVIELVEEPLDVGLVQIKDFDGDGRSDLGITRPLPPEGPGASAPVILDLYLSRGAR